MAFELSILNNDTLEINYKGIVTREEVMALRKNAMMMIDRNKLQKLRVSLLDANLQISTVDLFNFAASNKKAYPQIRKTAIIYDPSTVSIEGLLLYKDSASSRGFLIELFEDADRADLWLDQ